jgi:hypothetical protein
MDFSDVDKLAEYRQQAREWVERHVDPDWAERVLGLPRVRTRS